MNDVLIIPTTPLTDRVAARYAEKGFRIVVAPTESQLPFPMAGYIPDLIALSPDQGGLVVEVRSAKRLPSADRLVEVAKMVSEHPGWRFILATGDELSGTLDLEGEEVLSVETIQSRAGSLRKENGAISGETKLLQVWPLLEAALRRRALDAAVPVEQLGHVQLIQYLYSLGYISGEQYDVIYPLIPLRNRLMHGYEVDGSVEAANDVLSVLDELLSDPVTA